MIGEKSSPAYYKAEGDDCGCPWVAMGAVQAHTPDCYARSGRGQAIRERDLRAYGEFVRP